MTKTFKCFICDKDHTDQKQLMLHIKKEHNEYTYESYVVEFYFNGEYPLCKCGCGQVMKFFSHEPNFFNDYAKNHFPRKLHSNQTKELIKQRSLEAIRSKFGVDNIMDIPEYVDKIKETKRQKYNDETYNNLDKAKETFLIKYGNEKYRNTEQMIATNWIKFNAASYPASEQGKIHTKKSKLERYGNENFVNIEKIRDTKIERYGYSCEFLDREWRKEFNNNDSLTQLRVMNDLESDKFVFSGKEYDVKFGRFLIEIDGQTFHGKNMNNLSIIQLNNIINDYDKTKNLIGSGYELIRVPCEEIKKIPSPINFEDVWNLAYEQDFNFNFETKFINRDSLIKLLPKIKDKSSKYVNILLKFIRTFQPTFPDIPTSETIDEMREKIGKYDLNALLDGNIFNNNSSLIGVSYLKSTFKSYWKSSYKDQKSPIEAWNDDNIMRKIIEYRIGLNSSGEVFDFSIHQLIRGLSARRFNISFFKPVLAAAIYRHFIGNNPNPTVFDPCCGFGGRLLAFKSIYPNGTYIGCEPNIETYNELVELSKNFTDVLIYNCKIEDFDISLLPDGIDLTFTSIPYFDTETYSNPVQYSTFESWKDEFIGKVIKLPNLLLNIPENLKQLFEGYEEYKISTNTSHFNQKSGKKFEYLLKF